VGAVQGRDRDRLNRARKDVDADAEVGQLHEARFSRPKRNTTEKIAARTRLLTGPAALTQTHPAVIAIVKRVDRHRLGPPKRMPAWDIRSKSAG